MNWAAWFQLELTRPLWLIGLLLLPVLTYGFVRSLADFPRWQRALSLAVRTALLLLIVLALSGLTLLSPSHQQHVVFAVDRSLSVDERGRSRADEFIREALEHRGAADRASVVAFAAEPEPARDADAALETSQDADHADDAEHTDPSDNTPATDAAPNAATIDEETTEEPAPSGDDPAKPDAEDANDTQSNRPPGDVGERADQADDPEEATNIAAALELADASVPPSHTPRIVLLTDGRETRGRALRAARSLSAPVATVPLPPRKDPEVQVSSLTGPAAVARGEPFHLDLTIDANRAGRGTVELFRGPRRLVRKEVDLEKGENTLRLRQTVETDRVARFSARVTGFEDTLLDNNRADALVFGSGKPRVLLIESHPRTARHLRWALEEEDIRLSVRPPEGMPRSLGDLQNFELVMLSNVPATDLSRKQMEIAQRYVRDLGGGLIMIGGEQSFGLGGYYKSLIERVLPVRSDFEKEKRKPSLAMVLVIDKSGSMGGMKIELAKDAARSAAELLGPRDKLGVIAFDGSPYWISPIRSATDRSEISRQIASITAGGGTSMAPPMQQAYEALRDTTAKLKHVIVLTDGHSQPGDFQGITGNMAASRITVSTVGVGSGADQRLLEQIAEIGKGRYHFTDDPSAIPQIFAKETVEASKSAINERPFLPQLIRPTPVLSGIDLNTAPFLLGYVRTRAKPTSELILATEQGDPLLAWWRYGLGFSVAFTSDAKSRWAAEWVSWPGFSRFWAQLVRHAMRKRASEGVVMDVQRRGSTATVTVDAVDASSRYVNGANTELTVVTPDLRRRKLTMRQTAPGRYEAEFEADDRGAYHLELQQETEAGATHRQSRGLVVGYPDELRIQPADEDLLAGIAEATGGTFQPEPADAFTPAATPADRALPLWPALITAAMLLLVLDVALRRVDLSRFFSRPTPAPAGAAEPRAAGNDRSRTAA